MKSRIVSFLLFLVSNYWVLPAGLVVFAILLSFGSIWVDHQFDGGNEFFGLFYMRDPRGARAILSTVAVTAMTIAVTAFSITIVTLQLASSQLGPRILRYFMKDAGSQLSLGLFLASFIYALLILRAIKEGGGDEFVPHISATMSLLFALLCVGVLIYFIHHVIYSIQAENVIAEIGEDLDKRIDTLFPSMEESPTTSTAASPPEEPSNRNELSIHAHKSGYVKTIDFERLVRVAHQYDLEITVRCRPGNHVVHKSVLLYAAACKKEVPEKEQPKLKKALRNAMKIRQQRSEEQDGEFAINQLLQIASRALSSGINDPFTAIRTVDQLCSSLSRLAERAIPSRYLYDETGVLRVIADPVTFRRFIDASFNQLRQYGRGDVSVMIRLLDAIAEIARHAKTEDKKTPLYEQAVMIERWCKQNIPEERDRLDLEKRYRFALGALGYENRQDTAGWVTTPISGNR